MNKTNVTNQTFGNVTTEEFHAVDPGSYLVPIMWILIILTVTGNGLVITSILTNKKTRKVLSNRFILSLSAADFMVGLFVMAPSALKAQANSWNYGLAACKLWNTMDIAFCSASIYNLIGISIDRCYAIYNPISYVVKKRYWLVNLKILLAWFMGLIISLPAHIKAPGFSNWHVTVTQETAMQHCGPPVDEGSVGFVLYSATLAFFIPSVCLAALQTAIFIRRRKLQKGRVNEIMKEKKICDNILQRQQSVVEEFQRASAKSKGNNSSIIRNQSTEFSMEDRTSSTLSRANISDMKGDVSIDEESHGSEDYHYVTFTSKDIRKLQRQGSTIARNVKLQKKLTREENIQRQITRMMAVVIGTFVFCWTPFAIMYTLFPTSKGAQDWFGEHSYMIELITWLGYINSSLNPLIYAAMNKNIRHGIVGFAKRILAFKK